MPAHSDLDFHRLRAHRGSQAFGFEELLRQSLILDPPAGCQRLEHKGAGADGGVEVLAHMADGSAVGYQSKYFIETFAAAQIAQIRESFRQALTAYPQMTRYVVAIPRNLSGSPGRQSMRRRWDEFAAAAVDEAIAVGRTLDIELWDASALTARLLRNDPRHAGLRLFFFDDLVLTENWHRDRFAATRAELADRYLPDDHVDVEAQSLLDLISRNGNFTGRVKRLQAAWRETSATFDALRRTAGQTGQGRHWTSLGEIIRAGMAAAQSIDVMAPCPMDLSLLRASAKALHSDPASHAVFNDFETIRVGAEDDSARTRWRHLEYKFDDALDTVHTNLSNIDSTALTTPRVLIVGEAGAGKSHSLAHMVNRQIASGGSAVLFLGQQFSAGDPRAQMMARLGLPSLSFDVLLGALNACALASGLPSLIVIDALNEAESPHLWSTSLAGLAADIARFPALGLVVSCRDVYEERCIPSHLDITRHQHFGFEGDAAAAAKTYLDRHGIDRPAAPFLDPAFTNPLFLSTCVRRLVAEGKAAFPTGLEGITRLFDFWLEGVEASLARRGYVRIVQGDGRLRASLRRFADQLALEGRDQLPMQQARELFERGMASYAVSGPEDELLFRLVAEGVLRRDPGSNGEEETVAFTFQRFSDHFIAEAVLRLNDTPAALAAALRPGGDFHHLVDGDPWDGMGVQEALTTQVPERFGVELPDLEPGFAEAAQLGRLPWLDSLRWRAPGATSKRTIEIFESLRASRAEYDNSYASILLQAGTVPGHALNADHLNDRLAAMTLPERDAEWAAAFHWAMSEDAPAETLLDWAENARTDLADPERVRLALIILIWLLLSPNRHLRDRATKAITSLFLRSPGQIAPAIRRFADVDDPYVRERLFAAALGATLHLHDQKAAVSTAAAAVDAAVFSRPLVERHVYVRRYAQGIIEAAAARGWASEDMLKRARPPYNSEPIVDWPTWDDLRPHDPEAREILWSTVGHVPAPDEHPPHLVGDFGRYTMGGTIDDFSAAERTSNKPLTIGDERATFLSKVRAAGGDIEGLLETAQAAHDARDALWRRRSLEDIRQLMVGSGSDQSAEDKSIEAAANETLDAFLKALPAELSDFPYSRDPFRSHRDDDIPTFSRAQAQRWVAARAIALGWKKDLHSEIERLTSRYGGRNDHAVERLGKKYQWIAFHELVGALADRHWQLSWRKRPIVMVRVEDVRDLDIDPSFFEPKPADKPPAGLPILGLPEQNVQQPAGVDEAISWARSADGHPDPSQVVEGRDTQDQRWWLIDHWLRDRDYMEKMQSEQPVATGQWSIDLIVLAHADAPKLHQLLAKRHLNNIDFVDRDERRGRLFGEFSADLGAGGSAILNRQAGGVKYGTATLRFTPFRGEYDHSGVPQVGFHVPRPWLINGLSLRPAGPSKPWFVTPEGTLALIDPSVLDDVPGRPMLNAELLEPLLEQNGLTAAWVTWMEKDGGEGRGQNFNRHGRYERETYAGLWWRDGGGWQGSSWRVDGGQLNPHLEDLEPDEDS